LLRQNEKVSNKGGKTPGVDGIIWKTAKQKIQATLSLKRHGYNPLPSRRINVPKKQKGKFRPISIPTMKDKAMQALWHMALLPIAEERSDLNSYGFRPKRSTSDAIEQCFKALCKNESPKWVFEGDIRSCFDKISHQWLLENIPMDKQILRKFLKAGFMEKQKLYPTELGTEQGSTISPTLAIMALSGIERKVRSTSSRQRAKEQINFVSYGLELSQEKSKITHIDEGFNFLGLNVRKYKGKLLIKPAKENIKTFLQDIRSAIKANYSAKTENLINLLNPKIRGWANYFCSAVSSKAFSYVDNMIYRMLKSWLLRRHSDKSKSWIIKKYYIRRGLSKWNFHAMIKDKKGNKIPFYLYQACKTPIARHIKIKGEAHPFNPKFKDYFKLRDKTSKTRLTSSNSRLKLNTRLLGDNVALLRA